MGGFNSGGFGVVMTCAVEKQADGCLTCLCARNPKPMQGRYPGGTGKNSRHGREMDIVLKSHKCVSEQLSRLKAVVGWL